MSKPNVQLYKARDADDGYGIRLQAEQPWLSRSGFGSHFEPVWTVEVESELPPHRETVNWEAVLDRVVEAYRLSDPILTGFQWPQDAGKSEQL